MKIWHITFTAFQCFKLDAVVVAPNYGEAVTLLKLGPDERLKDAVEIGTAKDATPRIITMDSLV